MIIRILKEIYTSIIHEEINKLVLNLLVIERWDKLSRSIQTVSKDVENFNVQLIKQLRFDSIDKVEIELQIILIIQKNNLERIIFMIYINKKNMEKF